MTIVSVGSAAAGGARRVRHPPSAPPAAWPWTTPAQNDAGSRSQASSVSQATRGVGVGLGEPRGEQRRLPERGRRRQQDQAALHPLSEPVQQARAATSRRRSLGRTARRDQGRDPSPHSTRALPRGRAEARPPYAARLLTGRGLGTRRPTAPVTARAAARPRSNLRRVGVRTAHKAPAPVRQHRIGTGGSRSIGNATVQRHGATRRHRGRSRPAT